MAQQGAIIVHECTLLRNDSKAYPKVLMSISGTRTSVPIDEPAPFLRTVVLWEYRRVT